MTPRPTPRPRKMDRRQAQYIDDPDSTCPWPTHCRRARVYFCFGTRALCGVTGAADATAVDAGRTRARRMAASGRHPGPAEYHGRDCRPRSGLRRWLLCPEAVADRGHAVTSGRRHPSVSRSLFSGSDGSHEAHVTCASSTAPGRSSLAVRPSRCRVDREHLSRTRSAYRDPRRRVSRDEDPVGRLVVVDRGPRINAGSTGDAGSAAPRAAIRASGGGMAVRLCDRRPGRAVHRSVRR